MPPVFYQDLKHFPASVATNGVKENDSFRMETGTVCADMYFFLAYRYKCSLTSWAEMFPSYVETTTSINVFIDRAFIVGDPGFALGTLGQLLWTFVISKHCLGKLRLCAMFASGKNIGRQT